METSHCYGILAPAKTPKSIIGTLNVGAYNALKSSGINSKFAKDDARAGGVTPEQFAAFIENGETTWKQIIEKMGLKID